jgi:hypothetical protein
MVVRGQDTRMTYRLLDAPADRLAMHPTRLKGIALATVVFYDTWGSNISVF